MALTAYDQAHLTSAQQVAIQNYSDAWDSAYKRGDTNAMEQARLGAMAIRNSAGYTTSLDGSQVTGTWNPVVSESVPDYNEVLNRVQTIAQENNAQAQANAQAQWDFNREEAQKNRDWQEYMSSTAHQREVKDLLAAGLNPILSAGGSGAAVTSGATASGSKADVDTSASSVFGSFLNALVSSATNIVTSQNSALSAENVARINTLMQYKLMQDFPTTDRLLGSAITNLTEWLMDKFPSTSGKGFSEGTKQVAEDYFDFKSNERKEWLDLFKKLFQ